MLALLLDERLSPVAAWRRYRGLSQTKLAERAKLSQTMISGIERGARYGRPDVRRALATALDAPLWTLDEE